MKPKQIIKHLGKDSGAKGVFYALIGGIISTFNSYLWKGPMKTVNLQIIVFCFAFTLLFVFTTKTSAETMMIAVASSGQTKDAAISGQAGRAPFFLLFDDQGNFLKSIANPAGDQFRKAGPEAALFLADQRVTLVIAGEFGSKMIQVLEKNHIRYVKKKGIVDHAVQTIIQDRIL